MEFETRYGPLYVTRHAFQRWVQRTGRSELEMLGALSRAWRPSKRQLRRIGSARRDGARAGSSNVTMPISS